MFDIFAEGDREQDPERQYITLVDFPVPVTTTRGVFVKRVKTVIDVTGRGLPANADQYAFDNWATEQMERNHELAASLVDYAAQISSLPFVQAEANAFLRAVGRTIQ